MDAEHESHTSVQAVVENMGTDDQRIDLETGTACHRRDEEDLKEGDFVLIDVPAGKRHIPFLAQVFGICFNINKICFV